MSISNDLIKSWKNATTIAFSKTDDKKIKLASTNLDNTFQNDANLTNFEANSLDTSSVTSMQSTFDNASKLFSLSGVSDWDVSNVTNMSALFQNCKAFLFPSLMEGFGIPPLEALYNGVPIIISDTSSLPEIYEDCAHYIDPMKYDYCLDEILNEQVGAPEKILEKFSWKISAQQWYELIRNFAG